MRGGVAEPRGFRVALDSQAGQLVQGESYRDYLCERGRTISSMNYSVNDCLKNDWFIY